MEDIHCGRRRQVEVEELIEREWVSYHISYHSPQDELLLGLILPAMNDLWHECQFSQFFFVRYNLGGPHVRLRLRPAPGAGDEIDNVLMSRSADFFRLQPSVGSLSENVIRECNRRILAASHEGIDIIYSDNSIMTASFEPEIDRYGGASLIESSLAFFSISSAYALRLVELRRGQAKARFLAYAMRALLSQALGFASNGEELARLVTYAMPVKELKRSALIDRADQEFYRQSMNYTQLVCEEVENARSRTDSLCLGEGILTEASRRLKTCIRDADAPARWQVLSSQLHMTANRLGIYGVEEIYLGRILQKALERVSGSSPSMLRFLQEASIERPRSSDSGLEDLVLLSLEDLFGGLSGESGLAPLVEREASA